MNGEEIRRLLEKYYTAETSKRKKLTKVFQWRRYSG
jgi:hypothetical protein